MNRRLLATIAFAALLPAGAAWADEYQDTIEVFRKAGESAAFFQHAHGYAVFPTVAKGGVGVGAAHGSGRVYENGRYIGDTSMTQLSVGWQLGGQAFSQIVFFEDARALKEFTSGNFEFSAEASAVALTAGAGVQGGTAGVSAGMSGGRHDAKTVGRYFKGMATFTVAKGGLMYQAAVGGQKFTFKPR